MKDISKITTGFIDQAAIKSAVWLGTATGMPFADGYARCLRGIQFQNVGVAQIVARYEQKRQSRENMSEKQPLEWDSDNEYPVSAEQEEWYPFETPPRKVS